MIKNYGLEGKEEAPLVTNLVTKLFAGINSDDYSCINLCGIQPYTRRKREIDFLMLVNFDDKSKLREHRVTINIEDARRVKTRATVQQFAWSGVLKDLGVKFKVAISRTTSPFAGFVRRSCTLL